MVKRYVSRGQFTAFAGLCCGDETHPMFEEYEEVFTEFYAESTEGAEDGSTLEHAIDVDLSRWGLPTNFILWALCRAHIVDSFVLRLFASDCIENVKDLIVPDDKVGPVIVDEAVACARSYAVGDCDHEMLMEMLEKVESYILSKPWKENEIYFLNTVAHTLRPHPDGGAIQCVMNIPRCLEQMGIRSEGEMEWQRQRFRSRCEEQGWFDDET